MNRRRVLQGLAALPFATAFAGCHRDDDDKNRPKPPEGPSGASGVSTLRIILMGPFAVVQQRDKNYRIKVYVPFDDERQHEFRFPGPVLPDEDFLLRDEKKNEKKKKHDSYQFTIQEESLKVSDKPYVDRGFDGFNVEIPEWKPPSDAFVSLDLPAPNVITYLPPPERVLFESSDQFPHGQFTTLPLNHVLEYTVKEGCKVRLLSKQLGECTPLTCEDLHQQIIKYGKDHEIPDARYSLHPLMDQTLTRCSPNVCTFFLGVGLPPPPKDDPATGASDYHHALKFFNKDLLTTLYGPKVPPGKRIAQFNASPCGSSSEISTSPMLIPAVQRLSFPQPRYLPVASTENCTAPGVTTAIRTLGSA